MKPLPWFVLAVVTAVMVTISFSQDPAPVGNTPKTPARSAWAPRHSFDYPALPSGLPAGLPLPRPLDKYVVLAWNDLGMHCYQADFSTFQILPPYNVFWAQVIQRGQKPAVVTKGVELRYETLNVTDPVRHTNFWDYAAAYGWKLQPNVGLKGKRTSGNMEAATDHFVAEGVPVVDFHDDGTWDPFPMFTVSVQDRAGQLLAQTVNVAPASTEMSCDLCQVADTLQGSMAAILKAHGGGGIYCCACHGSPHTITPAATLRDNEQAVRLQGEKGPINKCTVCHVEKPEGAFWHFRKAE